MYKIGDIVKHYKGNHYQIVGFAKHTESLEKLIIYRPYNIEENTTKNTFWARPVEMFDDIIDGCCTKRFTLIDKENTK